MGKKEELTGASQEAVQPKEAPIMDAFEATFNSMSELGADYNPVQHADLTAPEISKTGTKVTLDDPAFAWEKHKAQFGEENKAAFDQVYGAAQSFYGKLMSNDFNYPEPKVQRTNISKILGYGSESIGLQGTEEVPYYPGFMPKGYDPVWTDSDIADSKGKYLDKYGNWKELGFVDRAMKIGENTLDAIYQLSPGSVYEDLISNVVGRPSDAQEAQKTNGIEVIQTRDQNGWPVGQPYLKEIGDNENKYGKEMYSFWGPNSMYGNFLADAGKSFLGEAYNSFLLTPKTLKGRLGKAMGLDFVHMNAEDAPTYYTDTETGRKYLVDYVGSNIEPDKYEKNQEWLDVRSKSKNRITPEEYSKFIDRDAIYILSLWRPCMSLLNLLLLLIRVVLIVQEM
jgi:hypothetical protein